MKKISLLLITIAFLVSSVVHAESIILKDGSQYTGKITQNKDNKISIQTDYGLLTFTKDQIESINFDSSNSKKNENNTQEKPDPYYIGLFGGAGVSNFYDKYTGVKHEGKYLNIAIDLSFYFPLSHKFLMGAGFSLYLGFIGSYEKLPRDTNEDHWSFSLYSQEFYHLDVIYFFKQICDGAFFKLSPGVAMLSQESVYNSKTLAYDKRPSDYYVGTKAGIGYAFEITKFGSAFIIGFDYQILYKKFSNDRGHSVISSGDVYIGGMW